MHLFIQHKTNPWLNTRVEKQKTKQIQTNIKKKQTTKTTKTKKIEQKVNKTND